MAEFEMPIEEQIRSLARQFGSFEKKLTSVESKLTAVESKLTSVESKLTSGESKLDSISVRLDDTRQVAKLGLEAVQGLRESTDKAHAEMRRDHDNQADLLKSVLVHVRKRVDRVEPKRRRRS